MLKLNKKQFSFCQLESYPTLTNFTNFMVNLTNPTACRPSFQLYLLQNLNKEAPSLYGKLKNPLLVEATSKPSCYHRDTFKAYKT